MALRKFRNRPVLNTVRAGRSESRPVHTLLSEDREFNTAIPEFAFLGIVTGDGLRIPKSFRYQDVGVNPLLDEVIADGVGTLLGEAKVGS